MVSPVDYLLAKLQCRFYDDHEAPIDACLRVFIEQQQP